MYTHQKKIITAGKPVSETGKAIVFIHGRGASAESILSLSDHLDVSEFSLLLRKLLIIAGTPTVLWPLRSKINRL